MLAAPLRADVRMPRIFSSDMVLQRDRPIPVWGWAEPGEKVTVRLAEKQAAAIDGTDGKWTVRLPALSAGEPLELTVAGKNTMTNVLMGKVWLCSGQSNMEQGVGISKDAQDVIGAATNARIRLCLLPKVAAGMPTGADTSFIWTRSTATSRSAPSSPRPVCMTARLPSLWRR